MNKILSQEEIDALLSTVTRRPEEGYNAPTASKADVQVYDFKHPERISKEQIRTLRTIHDGFGRMFATYLSTTLRSLVDVNLLSIDQVTFSEYSLSLSVPNALYILKSAPLEGKMLLEISPQFLLFIVDRMLGGMGDIDVEAREISIVEQNVVARIIQTIISQLNEVWRQIYDVNLELDGFESDPQFVQIARSSDTLAIIFFDIRVRGTSFAMNIAIPYFTLEPIINKLSVQSMMAITGRKVGEGSRELIAERLRASKLAIQAVLADTTLKVRDFMDLQSEDLIQLDKKSTDLLQVRVGGKLKYFASAGKLGRKRAIKVVRQISPDEELIYE